MDYDRYLGLVEASAMISLSSAHTELTLKEFLAMPEAKPAREYLNGQIWEKPMPQWQHSLLQLRLASSINLQGVAQQRVLALPELRCTFGGQSLVPDIAVFHWERIPKNELMEVVNEESSAPDWVIEIISPSQSPFRVINKVASCIEHGTQLGWVIHPEERMILVMQPQEQPESKEGDELLPVLRILEDLKLTVNEVFSWLKV
jgi:Uma2 family endonuclease